MKGQIHNMAEIVLWHDNYAEAGSVSLNQGPVEPSLAVSPSSSYCPISFFCETKNYQLGSTDKPVIALHEVPLEDKTLVRRESAVLQVLKSECGEYHVVDVDDFDMSIAEPSLDELKHAIDSVLRMMWKRYVMGDPEHMTPRALDLRDRLTRTYRLV